MRTGCFKSALLLALVITSLIMPVVLLSSPSLVHAAMTPHAPIYINGNSGFTKPDPVNGGGSGAENDPYIIENYIIDASTTTGIEITNTTARFLVRNCVVENGGMAYDGIYLSSAVNGRIENSTCENNWAGIYLSVLPNNTLDNNTCRNNEWGIFLWDSDNNTLTNNTCDNNSFGIDIYYSNNNRIYHNNLISNAIQAYDDHGTNHWDDSYPSGGNYWSDYTGVDENQGENQDIPGSDGIGDVPYNISGGSNQDCYPLMNPWPCSIENYFDLHLLAGWNLVGFTRVSENDTPDNILAGQTYYIWKWDPVNKWYVSPPSDEPVELGVGYWVWVDNDMTVKTSGVPVENYSIDLITGWNLVGFPVTNENTTPDNLFSGYTYYIWKWDAVGKTYTSPSSTAPVEPGVGYWVWVENSMTVTVPL